MDIKLIALDLDGTLLKNKWQVHPYNLKIIERVHQERPDIKIVISTGRAPVDTFAHAKTTEINTNSAHIVCYNGGNVISMENNNNKILYEKNLSIEDIKQILAFAKEHKLLVYGYALDNKTAYINRWSYKILVMRIIGLLGWINHLKFKKIDENNVQPMYKILLLCKNKKSENAALEGLNKISNFELSTSSHSVIEVNPEGVSKKSGVEFLCDMWNINRNQVLAIGDGMNDYKVIAWAKYGIAMENSHPNLKNIAFDITTKNTDGGVGKAIEKYVFSKQEIEN